MGSSYGYDGILYLPGVREKLAIQNAHGSERVQIISASWQSEWERLQTYWLAAPRSGSGVETTHWGFGYWTDTGWAEGVWGLRARYTTFFVPHWLLLAVTATLPAKWLTDFVRSRHHS